MLRPGQRVGWCRTLAISAALLAYGNVTALLAASPGPGALVPLLSHPLAVLAALLCARRAAGCTWDELGLGRRGWACGSLWGFGMAAFMAAIVGGLILLFRAVHWTSSTAYPAPADPSATLLLGGRLLLLTAVCEEVWFRGVLHALWVRQVGLTRGVVVVALLFAAWHLTVWGWTLQRVTLQPALPLALTYPAGLLALFIAGLLFGWLRAASGHLAGPIVAHWAIDLVLIALAIGGWL